MADGWYSSRFSKSVVLNQRGSSHPRGQLPQFEMLLALSRWRSGMQLNTPQCIGWPPRQRMTQPNVRGVKEETSALSLLKAGIKVNAKQTAIHLV